MKTVIRSKQLITDPDKPAIPGGLVIIEGDRISKVGTPGEIPIPRDSQIINCENDTVLPGLIDSHAHISSNNKYRLPLRDHFELDLPTVVLRGSMNLRSDLASGVTSMRTCGDIDDIELRFKRAIERNEIPGPRLTISIRAFRPSHGTAHFLAASADGPDELTKMVRENFSMGGEFIKLFVTNVTNGASDEDYRRGDLTEVPAYSENELVAAISTAHDLGMKVAGHAEGGPGMIWAIKAGIDSIEHACLGKEEDIEYFIKYGTFISCPNLQVFFDKETGFESRPFWEHDWWRQKVKMTRERMAFFIPLAIKSGVKMCLATDSGHGFLWKEAKFLVELGASPKDALLCLTKNSSELLGMTDQLGTLEPGKTADVISVRGDPLKDITVLQNVDLVVKSGRIYHNLL